MYHVFIDEKKMKKEQNYTNYFTFSQQYIKPISEGLID